MKSFPDNPRKITTKQQDDLGQWLEELGDLSGIIHNNRTDHIVGGNQRSQVMDINNCEIEISHKNRKADKQGTLALGYAIWKGKRYNYRLVSWDEETEKKANIVANKAGGTWDNLLLKKKWDSSSLLEWGFSEKEVPWHSTITDPASSTGAVKIGKKSITKPGTIYELVDETKGIVHRVMLGDITSFNDIEALMDGKKADVLNTDPPYNVDYEGSSGMKIENDKMEGEAFYQFLFDSFDNCNAFVKKGGCAYIAHADTEGIRFRSAFVDAGFMLKQVIVWVKNAPVMGRQDYNWQHEPVIYGWKPGGRHYFRGDFSQKTVIEEEPKLKEMSHEQLLQWAQSVIEKIPTSVIRDNKPKKNSIHPTMKPVSLFHRFIVNSSKERQIVLDPFLGSGTSLIASQQAGRQCYGMDIDPIYLEASIYRWWEFMEGKGTIKANGKPFNISRIKKLIDGKENRSKK